MKNQNIKKCIASLFAKKCIASLLCKPSGSGPTKGPKLEKGKFVKRSFAVPYKKIIFAKHLHKRNTPPYLCNITGESHKPRFHMYTFKNVKAKADTILTNRKESHYYGSILILEYFTDKEPAVKLDLRFYATQAVNYCCVWHTITGTHQSGGGKASGYGYAREGSAASEAMEASGLHVVNENGSAVLDCQHKSTVQEYILQAVRNMHPDRKFIAISTHA